MSRPDNLLIKHLVISLLTLISMSCLHKDEPKIIEVKKDTTFITNVNKNPDGTIINPYFKIGHDSIAILSFEIKVDLSAKAKERIAKGEETIVVNVFFTGTPKDSVHARLEEDGSFYLTSATEQIQEGATARFDHIKFPRTLYDQLADKDIEIGVNVFSGGKSSRDNLLHCETLFDKISHVVNKRFTLHCKLIYGDD